MVLLGQLPVRLLDIPGARLLGDLMNFTLLIYLTDTESSLPDEVHEDAIRRHLARLAEQVA